MSKFSIKLKELRKDENLTIKEFAETLKMNMWKYAQYEKGVNKPSLELIKELYLVYDIDLEEWILEV